MTTLAVNGISLYVKLFGRGYPLLLMHGGPGADHHSMLAFRPLADRFSLIFYDHRCNGRSAGRDDFQFPPKHQETLANGMPNARLAIIDRAGHNAPMERPAEVIAAVRRFFEDYDPGPVPGGDQAALDRLRA